MSDSPLRRLIVHTSHYGLTSLLTMIAGLVSFPLLTRVFSVADYGAMNLVAATVTVSVTCGKVGVQHAILRYHSEIAAGKSAFSMNQLRSTTFFGMLATGLVVLLGVAVGARLVPAHWLGDARLQTLFAIASFLIIIQVIESALVNFVRAEQNTTGFMKYTVGKKYLTLAAIVVVLFPLHGGLRGFYGGTVIAEGISLAILFWVLARAGAWPKPQLAEFSRPLYRELITFGIPMAIGYELSGTILAIGDRYVIDGVIGEVPLGLYAAAYNLCQYVQAIVIASVGQAIMPIYLEMYDKKGPAETSQFVSRSLSRYIMLGAPVVAGLAAVSREVLPALASEKYAAAAGVLPWVIAGMVIDGTNAMVGAGLFIHRRTKTIMKIVVAGATLNILLNLALVPWIGIIGSAVATLVCYCFTALGMAIASRKLLPVALPWDTVVRAGAASAVMYIAVAWIHIGKHLATVSVRAAVGALVYAAIMIAIAPDARELAGRALARARS